jgi:hypothetical protein
MGWTVTGSSAARAWHGLSCGTWEPGAPMLRERPKREVPRKSQSTNAERRGGSARISVETW